MIEVKLQKPLKFNNYFHLIWYSKMKRVLQNKNLFNQADSDFSHSTIDILNITGTIDLSQADITGIDADDVDVTATRVFVSPSEKSQISTNQTNISTNTTNITTNQTNISTNISNIATNTANIATNTSTFQMLRQI